VSDALFVSGDDVPEYFRAVPLMTVGMSWPASTGPVTITMQHLEDAVAAASDPHIQAPRIKLGHSSSINGDHEDHNPFAALGDAEPSFGQFVNLRTVNDGAVLVGDADNVIAWLALSAPSTYPNRSAEATWAVEPPTFDVQTAGGKRYSMCLTAVSFLGVELPAIGDLKDLSELIMDGPSALTAAKTPAALAADGRAALSISEDEIRQRFNFDWAMDEENGAAEDTYWWWCREVRVSEGEVIADDDEGHLWMVPFTDADGVTTFGEPGEVRKTYIPVAASVAQVACFARPSKPQRPPVAAGTTPAAITRPDQGVNTMDDDVREFLVARGIDPEKATDVQINAASVLMAEQPAAEVEPPPEAAPPEIAPPAAEVVEAPETERVPVAAAKPDAASLTMAVDRTQWEQTQATLAEYRKDRRDTERGKLDGEIATALSKGRITPASREAWRASIDPGDSPDAATRARAEAQLAALHSLPEGLVPLEARAQTPDPSAPGDDGLTGADRELLAASRSRMNFKAGQEA